MLCVGSLEFYQKLANSTTSMLTTDSWNAVSPTGVNDFDFVFPEPTKVVPSSPRCESSASVDHSSYDDGGDNIDPSDVLLAEDPLEWLIDGGMNHLPDCTLVMSSSSNGGIGGAPPPFPDFKSDYLSADIQMVPSKQLETQHATSTPTEVALSNMADPSVTVQSLML